MNNFRSFSNKEIKQAKKIEDVFNYGIWLLSKKDYTINDLKEKLNNKTDNSEWINESLERLINSNYLNDKRFVENYLKDSYEYKQHGINKVKQELKQKGIDKELIENTILELEYDYFDLAYQCLSRKIRDSDLTDRKEKDRLTRFLLSRGFSFDMIRYAFEEYKSQSN
ncbi:MAG: regulatory protein RecX [Candidatus Sericytochromatia bacterium]